MEHFRMIVVPNIQVDNESDSEENNESDNDVENDSDEIIENVEDNILYSDNEENIQS